ncbi:MAG: Ig-like domain-containing protein [Anaeromyxobacteraceae bacterium]
MSRSNQRLLAVLAAALLGACGGSTDTPANSLPSTVLTVTATPASVTADGVQTVSVTVTGTATGTVSLSTSRGTFSTGDVSIRVTSLPASVTLIACDASTSSTCAGSALVRAADLYGAYGQTTVTFVAPSTPSPGCSTCGTEACVGQVCDSQGRVCSPGTPSTCSVCPAGTATCQDPTGQPALGLVAARTRIPADGVATTTITATLEQDGTPVAGKIITLATSLAGTRLSTPAVTDANGQTTAIFTSSDAGGEATITGTYAASSTVSATATVVVTMPRLALLTVAGYQHEVLGARESDFQEKSTVTFQALDTAGLPYPAGLAVAFRHESLGQSFIGESFAACAAAFPACQATGVTDEEGKALVTLTSGTAAGVVSISGGSTAGGLSASAIAHRLAIIGAKASGDHVVMDCAVQNAPALLYSDCANSHLDKTISCKVSLRDRFQNVVGRSTRVQFFAEAGSVGMPAVTPMYTADGTPGGEADLGIAVVDIRTDGKLPIDVAPFGGEFALTYQDACGTLTHNPRDGLVTVIAVVNGEEGFVDRNGNGSYDPGEPYIDMGEPYIDANDNGVYDPGEFFVDVNGNGRHDGPDGQWTRNAVLWSETRLLFTGGSFAILDGSTGRIAGSQFFQSGALPEPVTATPFAVTSSTPGPATSETYAVTFGDGNFNPVAPDATYALATGNGLVTAAFPLTPAPPFGLGISFTQQYCTKPRWEQITSGESCSNVCPSNGNTTNSPCYVVTNVGDCTAGTSPRSGCGGFSYGSTGTVKITGGARAGSDQVEAKSTLEGVTTSIFLGGTVN